MRVTILGGTGTLGHACALHAHARGHDVHVVSSRPARLGEAFATAVRPHVLDLRAATDDGLVALLTGTDAMVYALGPDDRTPTAQPPRPYYADQLVEATRRTVAAARRAGVRRVVILGSYFATAARAHPQWRLAEHHPYIAARLDQTRAAVEAGGGTDGPDGAREPTAVVVLELPYVFGVLPGRVPFWKEAFFDRVLAMPVVTFPRGGTITTTTTQVAQAAIGAAEGGRHGDRHPIGDLTLTWPDLLGELLELVGRRRLVVTVPAAVAQYWASAEARRARREGLHFGLDPTRVVRDLLGRTLTFDPEPARRALGFDSGGVIEAFRETVRACYPDPPGRLR